MAGERRELAWIAADLGGDRERDQGGQAWWRRLFRRNEVDFCALFAAKGLDQLESYLANWAAYSDYLATRE